MQTQKCTGCGMQVPDTLDGCLNCGMRTSPKRAEPARVLQPAAGGPPAIPTAVRPESGPVSAVRRGMTTPPPRPVEAAPSNGRNAVAAFGVVCSLCGRGPAIELRLRRHLGLFIVMRTKKLNAPFCREHGEAAALEYLRRTMVEGWWGFLSFFFNWRSIWADKKALRAIRQLGAPVGEVDASLTRELPDYVKAAATESEDERFARSSVLKTVVLSIGLGVVGLVAARYVVDAQIDSPVRILDMTTVVTTAVYASVALLLLYQLRAGHIRPYISEHGRSASILMGSLIGGAMAFALAGVMSLLKGHVTSDTSLLWTIFEGNDAHVAIMVFIAVVAAPFVEEPLFRGLLTESLRSRGRQSAVLGGAVAFSLWHLNPSSLRYYVLMGFIFGFIYWRLGLAGSIAAHAAFNGILVLFAFAAFDGGGLVTTPTGISAELPGGWHQVQQGLPPEIDLAAELPVGAAFVVRHDDVFGAQTGRLPDPENLPAAATNVRSTTVAGIPALRFMIEQDGVDTDVVLVPTGSRVYSIAMVSVNSGKAKQELETMLNSVGFPPP